ncbi:uncharacterized protein LOC131660174 [Vicia villosa]|uniref:uncharacterized protein LOC131660174 n=1 Tax=Vicia villosa TaxID=3911 RepID=UPI00273CB46E|nr:uncharacterized protein LOC131660174 [Vicia villosa]
MDSDDDFEPSPPSPIIERKLKRLKKASRVSENPKPLSPPRVSENPLPSSSPIKLPEFENNSVFEELNGESTDEIEALADNNVTNIVEEDNLGARRVLKFDSVDEIDGKSTEKTTEELGDINTDTDELEKKQHTVEDVEEISEKKESKKKKKKRSDDGDRNEKKQRKETISSKRKAEKERQENLKQLRAESQRLLRETRDAAFKPVPLVQKPISSILDKIRKRKLEFLKKSNVSFDDNDGFTVDIDSEHPCPSEEITNKTEKAEVEETPAATCPAVTENNLSEPDNGRSNDAVEHLSGENIPSPVAVVSEPVNAFRAPVDDTQDLFSDSEMIDIKEEAVNEKLSNPSEEVFAPSMLAMNLTLDSAPVDDDVSSDEEDNNKENTVPHLQESAEVTLPSSGDPVKAFVDEEAEEEDDSDNDLQRFRDNEEDEDDDDLEELNDMIATGYEEEPIDREKRDQLHQQWLEQQDTSGMDNLLQKLNCGSRVNEPTLFDVEEEDEESKETENESDDEIEDFIAQSDSVKINLKKVKQMIPQMFTDKEEAYVSSDEETEERLAKQSLSYKVEKKAQFFSPAEDENSRGIFNLIKKTNVPDTKRKGRTPSIFDMPHIGQNTNISSKSSFLRHTSNQSMPTSKKQGSNKVRSSYIFGRDDSNSRPSVLISEDSSDAIVRESQAPKVVTAKFQRNTQNKYAASSSKSQESSVSLLEVLRRSSIHTERSVQSTVVQQNESVFQAFKLTKKSIKTGDKV